MTPLEGEDEISKAHSAPSTAIRDFFTIMALSFHAVFEGMAVGLEHHADDVWKLFIGEQLSFQTLS